MLQRKKLTGDPHEQTIETLEKQKKNVVYVAIIRANSFLNIYADKDSPSEALQLLDKAVNKENARNNSENV